MSATRSCSRRGGRRSAILPSDFDLCNPIVVERDSILETPVLDVRVFVAPYGIPQYLTTTCPDMEVVRCAFEGALSRLCRGCQALHSYVTAWEVVAHRCVVFADLHDILRVGNQLAVDSDLHALRDGLFLQSMVGPLAMSWGRFHYGLRTSALLATQAQHLQSHSGSRSRQVVADRGQRLRAVRYTRAGGLPATVRVAYSHNKRGCRAAALRAAQHQRHQ